MTTYTIPKDGSVREVTNAIEVLDPDQTWTVTIEPHRKRRTTPYAGMSEKPPLWWGRGSSNCFAVVPNDNGPYHRIFVGTGDKGPTENNSEGLDMHLLDFQLRELGQFLIDVADGKPFANE